MKKVLKAFMRLEIIGVNLDNSLENLKTVTILRFCGSN